MGTLFLMLCDICAVNKTVRGCFSTALGDYCGKGGLKVPSVKKRSVLVEPEHVTVFENRETVGGACEMESSRIKLCAIISLVLDFVAI